MYIEVRFQAPSLLHLPALHQTGHCFGAGSLFIWPESVFSCPLPLLYPLSARQRLSPGGPLCQHLLTLPVMTLCQYLRFWDFCYLPQWSIPSGLLTQNLSFAFAPTRWQQCPTECPSPALPSPSKGYLFFWVSSVSLLENSSSLSLLTSSHPCGFPKVLTGLLCSSTGKVVGKNGRVGRWVGCLRSCTKWSEWFAWG